MVALALEEAEEEGGTRISLRVGAFEGEGHSRHKWSYGA